MALERRAGAVHFPGILSVWDTPGKFWKRGAMQLSARGHKQLAQISGSHASSFWNLSSDVASFT